jgi:hypothetical protein
MFANPDAAGVLHVELAPPPPIALQHLRGYFAGARPPANALWAFVGAPVATRILPIHASSGQVEAQAIGEC